VRRSLDARSGPQRIYEPQTQRLYKDGELEDVDEERTRFAAAQGSDERAEYNGTSATVWTISIGFGRGARGRDVPSHQTSAHQRWYGEQHSEHIFRFMQETVLCGVAAVAEQKHDSNPNEAEDKGLWVKQHSYIQSLLDLIHCYFVHSDWKDLLKRHGKEHTDEKQNEATPMQSNCAIYWSIFSTSRAQIRCIA
jgi:hypothetical protein